MENNEMDEKKEAAYPNEVDYDNMSEEEYYKEMEAKVEYYKKHYPDMYTKAEQWIKMLDHSEVYKQNSGEQAPSGELEQALDILKNMNYHGITEEELSSKDLETLNKNVPDWRQKLV
jgi:hypothetical protein